MKFCPKCKTAKPENKDFFAYNKTKPSGFNSWCRECNKVASKNHYVKNKEKRKTDAFERRKKQKTLIRDHIKSLNPTCCVCGERELICLDFHHLDPKEKKYEISKLLSDGANLSKVKDEIKKCCVLCSNCHRKFHAGLITLQ